jgi:hypothetical protein
MMNAPVNSGPQPSPRCPALQINAHDTPIVCVALTVMAKLQSSPSPSDHPAPQPLERGALRRTLVGSFSGIGDRKHTHIKAIPADRARARTCLESAHPDSCRMNSMVRSRGEGMRFHIYSRRPRIMAEFLCGGRATAISRCNARRINSEKLTFSRRALPSRRCWTSLGRRNVTGTLPFGSFVLGISQVYYCIIHPVKMEFSCSDIFAMTLSAACEPRNQRPLRSLSLWPSTEPSRRSPIKNIVAINLRRSGRSFTKKPECRLSFA